MEQIDLIDMRLSILEKKVGDWEHDYGEVDIKSELLEIRSSLQDIKCDDKKVQAHITKVESDFYDEGKGLKYELIELLKNFSVFMNRVDDIVYWGKVVVGMVSATSVVLVGGVITWFVSHHWK